MKIVAVLVDDGDACGWIPPGALYFADKIPDELRGNERRRELAQWGIAAGAAAARGLEYRERAARDAGACGGA